MRDEADELDDDLDDELAELTDAAGEIEESRDGDELVLSYRRQGSRDGVEMLRSDLKSGLLRIFPRYRKSLGFEDRFAKISEIQIENFWLGLRGHSEIGERYGLLHVVGLPRGFTATYDFGLGIMLRYRGFVDAVERRSECTVMRFVGVNEHEGPEGNVFRLRLERFEAYRAVVDRNRGRATTVVRRVLEAESHNAVADLFNLDAVKPMYGRDPVIRAMTEEISTGHVVDVGDRATLIERVRDEAATAARESPRQFGLLRDDVELVSLQVLIENFERDLTGQAARAEGHWQRFFAANPFALQQVFGVPIVIAREQAHVQAEDLDGRGSRIADFLCANTVTRTAVVVEIKTPAARLMESSPYRGRDTGEVYAPCASGLAGAVSQVQAQLASVRQDLSRRLSRSSDLGSLDLWHAHGAVIAGRVSDLTGERRESFLRYREGLSGVTVLGYDEVCERLKGLLALLRAAPGQETKSPAGID